MDKLLLFGIVCFREKFWTCDSFLSLLESHERYRKSSEIHIFVFDNTDVDNWVLEIPTFNDGITVNYVRYSENPGISYAYNYIADFAKGNNFEWLIFLDQDSVLPQNAYECYLGFAKNNRSGIAAPRISVNNRLFSPTYYKNYRTSSIIEPLSTQIELKNITCINSGLMVSVKTFFLVGGYSPKLRIDFCDHEFIERVSENITVLHILDITIHQNFSVHSDDLSKAVVRYSMFIQDLKAYQKIHNNSILLFFMIDLPNLVRLTLQHRSLKFFRLRRLL